MAKYLINIGPDTRRVQYKSKKAAYEALARAKNRKKPRIICGHRRKDSCDYVFRGRKYNWIELDEAVVLTLEEFWDNCL